MVQLNIMKHILLNISLLMLSHLVFIQDVYAREISDDDKSIVILYENDVHCAIDGYARLKGLRNAILKSDTSYVGITSVGDFLNGAVYGTLTQGEYIADVMRQVGYDAITLGNHEFDYMTPHLLQLLPRISTSVVCCNLTDYPNRRRLLPGYTVKTYGHIKIGYVGVCTTSTMMSESYGFFDKTGKQLFDLNEERIYDMVQMAVDSARSAGADYVVLLSHLGEVGDGKSATSRSMVRATHGIDIVFDGHTHSVIPQMYEQNAKGQPVCISQTGTQFAYIGKLLITPKGQISTELLPLSEVQYTDIRVQNTIDSVKTLVKESAGRQIGTCNFELSINDAKGERLVRLGETGIGNLFADAFRAISGADIGLMNGGGLRNSIHAGPITYMDIVNASSFHDKLCKVKVSGEQVLNMLQLCTGDYPNEGGSFPSVSGLKFTLHAKSGKVDNVLILNRQTGAFEPLQSDMTYTIGVSGYYAFGGFKNTLVHSVLLSETESSIWGVLSDYISKTLYGVVGEKYRTSEGRITILDD